MKSGPLGREFSDSRKEQYGRKVDYRREIGSKKKPPPEFGGGRNSLEKAKPGHWNELRTDCSLLWLWLDDDGELSYL